MPEVRIHAFLNATHASLYIDLSGDSLFKRGLREHTGEAPLKKNLAAGIIRLTGWDRKEPFLDPMCGSGTFVIEAAEMALNIAPGLSGSRTSPSGVRSSHHSRSFGRIDTQQHLPLAYAVADINTQIDDAPGHLRGQRGLAARGACGSFAHGVGGVASSWLRIAATCAANFARASVTRSR